MTQTFGYQYNTYPIYADEFSFEGAFKRFTNFPGVKEVYDYALMGLPKYFPLTGEAITHDMVEPFLNSAITEIEMSHDCNLSEVDSWHSEDYIDGMFTNNYMGMKLPRWPATQIIKVTLKYPHTNTKSVYQTYTIPPNWIYLRQNKINIVAAIGSVTVSIDNSAVTTAGGIFTYITGFGRGAYQPGTIEIVYKSGFQQDKMASSVVDLVKTWAAYRFLSDIAPVLFPSSGVQVSIDGVSQGVSYSIQQMLLQRLKQMEAKRNELLSSLKNQYAKKINMTFIGA